MSSRPPPWVAETARWASVVTSHQGTPCYILVHPSLFFISDLTLSEQGFLRRPSCSVCLHCYITFVPVIMDCLWALFSDHLSLPFLIFQHHYCSYCWEYPRCWRSPLDWWSGIMASTTVRFLPTPDRSSNSAQHHWRSIISCDCRTCMEQSSYQRHCINFSTVFQETT